MIQTASSSAVILRQPLAWLHECMTFFAFPWRRHLFHASAGRSFFSPLVARLGRWKYAEKVFPCLNMQKVSLVLFFLGSPSGRHGILLSLTHWLYVAPVHSPRLIHGSHDAATDLAVASSSCGTKVPMSIQYRIRQSDVAISAWWHLFRITAWALLHRSQPVVPEAGTTKW